MADTQKKGELLGQPWWVWAAGAGAVVLGYIYLRSKAKAGQQGQAPPSRPAGQAPSRLGVSFTDLGQWARDHQAPVKPRRKKAG